MYINACAQHAWPWNIFTAITLEHNRWGLGNISRGVCSIENNEKKEKKNTETHDPKLKWKKLKMECANGLGKKPFLIWALLSHARKSACRCARVGRTWITQERGSAWVMDENSIKERRAIWKNSEIKRKKNDSAFIGESKERVIESESVSEQWWGLPVEFCHNFMT